MWLWGVVPRLNGAPDASLASDDFAVFDLPRRFALDKAELDRRRLSLLSQTHPDRFADAGASAQRLATQWTVRVNEAFARLKEPLQRAAYLCELAGTAIEAEDNTAMPTDFLMQQMQWREALDDASTGDAVADIANELATYRDESYRRLATTIDGAGDFADAARQVRALMFVERFATDVTQRRETLSA